MITIAEAHYTRIMDLVRLLNKNMELMHPANHQLVQMFSQWKSINESLSQLYQKITLDLTSILTKNSELDNQNKQLNNKLQAERAHNNTLIQSITMQRAQLAKNQTELNRYKDGVKKLKESNKQLMGVKDLKIEQLQKKVRKYKKISQQQEKKFQKLDKKITQITEYQIAQRSSLKGQQLNKELQELEQLQKMYNDLQINQDQQEVKQFEEDN